MKELKHNPVVTKEYREHMMGTEIRISTSKALLSVIIRDATPEQASVLQATGVQVEIGRHMEWFRNSYPKVERITDQAYRVEEIKAMYKAGFRCKDAKRIGLEETIKLVRNDNECLIWERE